MGLHICNNCDYKDNCEKAFQNSLTCLSMNSRIKIERERIFDNTELKEFKELLETEK